jgi:hypothetical protein
VPSPDVRLTDPEPDEALRKFGFVLNETLENE